ncbi:MAG TPA: discoidin domain-containing protein [Actinokineospora sp.]|nr:discoidin domain-containing protein [Actinokineospora sp.]
MKVRGKPIAILGAVALSGALVFSTSAPSAQAQQVAGAAPFINSWLVSGPFDTAVAEGIYGCGLPTAVNLARSATATATSSLSVNPPSQVIDGTTTKQWVTQNDTAPKVTLTWASQISLDEVRLAQWGDSRHVNNNYQITFTRADGTKVLTGLIASTSSSPSSPTVYQHPQPITNVVSMTVAVDPGLTPYPSFTGISEIEVYLRSQSQPGTTPITPVLGGTLGTAAQSRTWEYFDDRLYNRNYDDYQDLYGYFAVKKGQDTRNKFVYAHTYVYSPVARRAFVDVGASGSYRLAVNDRCVTDATTPTEVQKDLTKQEVDLKLGWNKVLIQIRHAYTEDVNANGVPIAKDQNVAYLGFYGRIADASGNRIDGVLSSVSGPSAALRIDNQSLTGTTSNGQPLPAQNLPTGYLEWPYVWNKSVAANTYGVAASPFQFTASGGKPGYTWRITQGVLPSGLALLADGTIASGVVNGAVDLASTKGIISRSARIGDYPLTLQVTDANGATASKQFTLVVKDRPTRAFEKGRVSALTHATPIYNYFIDPNYSVDQWAERAKGQGHSLVTLEALQQNYHWPSKFADPAHDRNKYMPKQANGQVVDGLAPFADAVRRYGMQLGIYYATEGGGLQHKSTDVFVQNVEDLLNRYHPSYLYFDGPQAMPAANFDVMYSAVRNHSADVIVNSNAWGAEYGDPDLRTAEASGIFAGVGQDHLVKQTPMEPWKMIRTANQVSPYYGQRDDFRQVVQETVMNAGRGLVDNNDQTVIDSRGPNWHTPTEMATRYPKGVQEFIDVRRQMVDWWTPKPGINLLESVTGTTPYYLPGYGYTDDGLGNYEKFARPNATTGPQWGYAVSRDNAIYLHIMKGPDQKTGFAAIPNRLLTIGGVTDTVTGVKLLNTGQSVQPFTQTGSSLTIDLTAVAADPIDTIIKVETNKQAREYQLTNVTLDAQVRADGELQLVPGGYMTYPALPAKLDGVTYTVANSLVLGVDQNGLVDPRANGSTTVTMEGRSGTVVKQVAVTVTVRNGVAYLGNDLSSAVLRIAGKETFGTVGDRASLPYVLEGRSSQGRSVRLDAASVVWHTGTVNLAGGSLTNPVAITEPGGLNVANGKVTMPDVTQTTRTVVWAVATLDGKTVTSNRVFLDVLPTHDVAKSAKVTTSDSSSSAQKLIDGIGIDATHLGGSGWSTAGSTASWVRFDLAASTALSSVDLTFNTAAMRYTNTPKTVLVQTSNDGTTWTNPASVVGPDGQAYFGSANKYSVTGTARYVRVSFPDGSRGTSLDLLEVAINAS